GRPETTEVDVEKAKQDAQEIIDAGPAKLGTDEAKFNVLFCNRSDSQLRAIFNEFAKLTGKSIEVSSSVPNPLTACFSSKQSSSTGSIIKRS
ncbi:unnamed protein product, partial [Adineta steineri]